MSGICYGIYVHDTKKVPYASWIVDGLKPIETRTRDVLGHFVGERVLIIRTRSGHGAEVIGSVHIAGKVFYTAETLEYLRDWTLIPPGDKYDCRDGGKWCYYLTDPKPCAPVPLRSLNVTRKTRSFAIIEDWD